jgi:predicted amidohydrolase YtcJ
MTSCWNRSSPPDRKCAATECSRCGPSSCTRTAPLGSRGALLSAPYTDEPSTHGLEVTPEARLADVVRRACRAGFQPCIHAIGDAAVTRVLDIYERELGPRGEELRPRVEHAQIVRPQDVPRFGALGAIASVQPTHCTSDMPWVPSRLGEERVTWAYRWRSLLAAKARALPRLRRAGGEP